MAPKDDKLKKPRRRPPAGAILVEGRWQLTAESVELAAQRLIKHRLHCRERSRAMRDAFRQQRPDLSKQPRLKQTLLVRSTKLQGEDLSNNQMEASSELCLQPEASAFGAARSATSSNSASASASLLWTWAR